MPAGRAQQRFTGWRMHASSFARAVLFAVALVGCVGLGVALLGSALIGFRYASGLLVAWGIGLAIGLRLPRSAVSRVVATFAVQLVLVLGLSAWLRRGPDRHELASDGDVLVAALERHFDARGRYPESLAQLGVRVRRNGFGGWKYEPRFGGRSYHLRCGEYDRDDFVLYRYAEDEAWQWDT